MPTQQTQLIGAHPTAPSFFYDWLKSNDITPSRGKRHRSLTELIPVSDPKVIKWMTDLLIKHHYDNQRIQKLKEKFTALGFPEYAKQHRKLPVADKTQKGNVAEILLIEYVEHCQAKPMVKVFKLHYNPNVDQAMKGDDMLLVDLIKDGTGKDDIKVYLGEAKFRKTPAKAVVDEITDALTRTKLPLSYSFMTDILRRDKTTEKLADLLDEFILKDVKAKGNLHYVGFLLSNTDTKKVVEAHLNNQNAKFVFVSAGIDDPEKFVGDAFIEAEKLVLTPLSI